MFCHCKPQISLLFVMKISAAHAFATQFSFYFYESECHIFHFVGWWDLCDGYTGEWQCLVPEILYQTHYYPLEPFGKVCMQVINILLKKGMSFHWCVHSRFWPTVCMFKSLLLNNLSIRFSHTFPCVRSWWFFPWEVCVILYLPVLTREMCVAASPRAEMCGDCGNLFIMWFCLLLYSALSERNDWLWEINAIWIFS